MSAKPKKMALTLSVTQLMFLVGFAFFEWHRPPHYRIWSGVLQGLILLNQTLILFMAYGADRAAPNPLIGLFPKSQQLPESNQQ